MRSLNIHTHILSLKEDAINRKKPLWVSKIQGVPISGKMMQNDGIYSRARIRDSIDLQNWSMLVGLQPFHLAKGTKIVISEQTVSKCSFNHVYYIYNERMWK